MTGGAGDAPTAAAALAEAAGPATIHATTAALGGRALLILGRPGAGKSGLALRLIALGAALVADDATVLRREGPLLLAAPPSGGGGLLEARGVGLLRVPAAGETPVALALDLDRTETERLPPRRSVRLLGAAIPLLLRSEGCDPAAAALACLRWGAPLDPDAPAA